MKNNALETMMGAVVLAVAAFFLAFAYRSSGYHDQGGQILTARFDRVDGLQVGSDVRVSGVKVGLIKAIEVDPKTFLAQVTISLTDAIKLPKDSSAEIVTDGLLGGKYMAIVPGGDEKNLKSGDRITHTQSSVSLEAMIGQLIFSNKKDDGKKEESTNGTQGPTLPHGDVPHHEK